jgi:superfamily II DNA or RNA helicase
LTMAWLPVDGAISLNLHRLIMKLRKWQQDAINVCLPQFAKGRKLFVIEGCTGSGKTLCSATAGIIQLENSNADLVVVLTPNCGTRIGWKKAFESLRLNGNRVNVTDDVNFPLDANVWVSTYAGYSRVEEALCNRPVSGIIAIIDEFHHPADTAEWGNAVDRLVSLCDHAIFLSGTPWKRDGKIAVLCGEKNIHGENYYQEEGRIKADFVYDYAADLREPKTRGTVPVKFKFWDSFWRSPDGKVCEIYKDLPKFPSDEWETIEEWEEWAKKCDKPLGRHLHFDLDTQSPGENQTIRRVIDEALSLLSKTRADIERSCGQKNVSVMLCVAKSMSDARKISEYIQEIRPSYRVSVVVSDDNNGAKKLEKIAKQCKENAADKPDVIVSVGMISEGVDIPQIKVVAYLSAIITVLYFIQVVGRAIRRIPIGKGEYADTIPSDTVAYVVAPAHPKLRYIARNIEKQVEDACGEILDRSAVESLQKKSSEKKQIVGTVTSGENSVGVFRGSEDFSQWHEIVETMKTHENAADCYIDSHWAEHILGLFLRGESKAEDYAIADINAKCRCLGVSVEELSVKLEDEMDPPLPYEEEQKRLSEKAIYWTNIIRFRGEYRLIEDNDVAFRKVRGEINRLAGLRAAGVTFSKASVEQRRQWVKVAEEIAGRMA